MPINSSSNDAFEMGGKGKRKGNPSDYSVTILSTRIGNEDGDSTDRIVGRGITVDTLVDIESVPVDGNHHDGMDRAQRQVRYGNNSTSPDAISTLAA